MIVENKKIIIGLALVWAFIIFYNVVVNFGGDNDPQKSTSGKSKSISKKIKSSGSPYQSLAQFPELKLSLLGESKPKYKGVRKNIFTAYLKPKASVKVKPKEEVKVEPPKVEIVISDLEKFLSKLSFMGFLERGVNKTLFLSHEDEVYLIKKGDRIKGRYIAGQITKASIIFTDIQNDETRTYQLRESTN